MKNCTKCGSEKIMFQKQVFSNGTEHLARICEACGNKMGYEAQQMTQARAETMKFPFGKYKDKTLKEIFEKDQSYISWCAKNLKPGNITKAIEFLGYGK